MLDLKYNGALLRTGSSPVSGTIFMEVRAPPGKRVLETTWEFESPTLRQENAKKVRKYRKKLPYVSYSEASKEV